MHAERHTVELTTNGDGDATGYTPNVTGRILGIRYVKTDFANGVDFDVTLEGTGEVVWDEDDVNASKSVYPQAGVHTTSGVAATFDGTYPLLIPIVAANDRVKIVVGSGGATKTGTVHIIVG